MLLRPAIARAELPALTLLLSLAALLLAVLVSIVAVAWPRDAAPRQVPVGRIGSLRPEQPTLVEVAPFPNTALPEIVIHDRSNSAAVYGRHPNPFSQTSPVKLVLVRTGPTTVVALLQADPFSPCGVMWQPQPGAQEFVNPCTGSAFEPTGELKRGPALDGMLRFPVSVSRSGVISVDVRGALVSP